MLTPFEEPSKEGLFYEDPQCQPVGKEPWPRPSRKDAGADFLKKLRRVRIRYMEHKAAGGYPVPRRVRESSDPAIQILLQAMQKCQKYNPRKRASARHIVAMLKKG